VDRVLTHVFEAAEVYTLLLSWICTVLFYLVAYWRFTGWMNPIGVRQEKRTEGRTHGKNR